MVCIQCLAETQIINSRLGKRNNSVWRRRKCLTCHMVFTTHETADLNAAWRVKSNGTELLPFNRDKLFISLYSSLQHRPTALTDAAGLTDTVIARLAAAATDGLIQNTAIIQAAVVALHRFDKAASTHYLAFHKA